MRRLRVLGLHGYHGNAAQLRRQLGPLAGSLDAVADVVCVDAPALAEGDFGWWHASEDAGAGVRYRGWARTRDWLAAFCAAHGPFDGVLGFSQGAALAAVLVALCALDGAAAPRLDFAIVIGGFASRDAQHAALFEAPGGIAAPSLHVIGRADAIVSPRASHALASRFRAPTIAEHDGGHVIAGTPAVRAAADEFLHAMARRPAPSHAARPRATPAPGYPAPVVASDALTFELPLWPGRARPAMRVYFPDADRSRPRPALVIFRGGGYARCDGSGGGSGVWAARQGFIGIEVDYGTRSTGSFYPGPYADAARAMRLVRHHARAWGVDPARVGALGYSAGGHLVSLLSTQPALWVAPEDDLAPGISARPDLVVLAYPLISFIEQATPGAFFGSVENFLGRADASDAERRRFSSELHVAPGHPPVFLWTTADDDIVPAAHAERFAEACRRAGVPIAFTLYPHGPHAMGLALDQPGDVGRWTTQLLAWLDQQWEPR